MKVPEPRQLESGTWFCQLRLNGKSISVTGETESECRDQAALIKAQYKVDAKKKKKPASRKEELTIEDVLTTYINSRKKVLSPSTIRGYNTVKDNRFQSYKSKKPSAIKDWQTVINKEIEDGASAKTVKNSWSLLTAALAYSGYEVPSVKLPAIMPATRPWLDADQIKVFVKAVEGADCEIPALLALHSLRRSEIMGLDWNKIDLEKKTIRVEGSAVFDEDNKLTQKSTNKSKNSRRTVPIMIPELETALKSVPEEKRTGNVVTCNPNTIWAQVNRICEANGLPKAGVHGLRHSFASLAVFAGLSPAETMAIGGWEDIGTMTKIYTHISDANRLKAQNKIAEFFKNAK